jgi:AcrR family transcriptional regulator
MSSSRTRARHTEATRKAILEAASELLMTRHGDFSMQEVAEGADLTHRTLYRYFPTRHSLLAATVMHISPDLGDDAYKGVSSVSEWFDAARRNLARAEERLPLMRNMIAVTLTSSDEDLAQTPRERDEHLWEVFRDEFGHLSDEDARRTFVAVRHLLSHASYLFFRIRFGLTPEAALLTVVNSAEQLVQQATLRNEAATVEARGEHR